MKILAFYLPQFHEVPENNEWWGEGFTEWTNVKKAEPVFKGQNQPRVPLDNNYYNLTDVNTLEWQADLAKKYGVYGFVYYHYWFEGDMLLEKPAEIMLKNKSVDLPFCFSWANHTWNRSWADKDISILKEQTYGDNKDWEKHFYYLLDFFQDDRYIKVDGKPLMIIYNPKDIKEFPEMMKLWIRLAKENGLLGITFMHQQNEYDHHSEEGGELFDYGIEFQMSKAVRQYINSSVYFSLQRVLYRIADKYPILRGKITTLHYSYDTIWKNILKTPPTGERWLPGAFVDWDNTPRRKNKGQVATGVTPEKFEKYLTLQVKRARELYESDYLFMFAWNEWGESGYLEPDTKYEYGMLEAIKKALINNNEFPTWEEER